MRRKTIKDQVIKINTLNNNIMIPEKGKVLVDFHAQWCGPCKAMKPTLEQYKESSKIPLVEINVDTENQIAAKYGVRSIPCFIVIEDGLEIKRRIGMQSLDQLKDLVK
jgi:thioredoxin 1|tara:strand:+ start:255 stop:578 length:324 start_codon:yes stop_codon:yes gene_type:complete